MHPTLPGALRYVSSIGLSIAVIALSGMFLIEAPNGAAQAKTTTAPVLRAVALSSPLPKLTAADFNIARSIPVVVAGKIEPVTVVAIAPTKFDPASTPSSARTATVIADAVNVRSGPSKQSAKTFTVRNGDTVGVLESSKGWTRIATPDGDSGWIWSKFLRG